jgi:hypothetical protein
MDRVTKVVAALPETFRARCLVRRYLCLRNVGVTGFAPTGAYSTHNLADTSLKRWAAFPPSPSPISIQNRNASAIAPKFAARHVLTISRTQTLTSINAYRSRLRDTQLRELRGTAPNSLLQFASCAEPAKER